MKKSIALALACAGATLAASPLAAAVTVVPSAPAVASPASGSAAPGVDTATQSLAFQFVSARALDDATYGKAVEVRFTVTNTGTTDGPFSFHVLTADGKNFLDDEGEEMHTGCDTAVSALRPGASTTCRTLMRMSAMEVASGKSTPQPIQFQWGTSGPKFPGFTVPSTTLGGAPVTPTPAETKALSFAYRTAVAKNDATYGPAVQVTFDVTNTGTTPGPWEFHVLTADGKNFLDDEGQEMYTGCDSVIAHLEPGATTTCRTYMRLGAADIAKGESPAMPVTFRWGSTGPTFDGFTVPVLNLSHLASTPAPTTPSDPKPSDPAPTRPSDPTPSDPAPSDPAPSDPAPATPSDPKPSHPAPTTPSDSKPVVAHPTMPAATPTTGPQVQTDRIGQGDDALAAGVLVAASLTAAAGAAVVLRRRRAAR